MTSIRLAAVAFTALLCGSGHHAAASAAARPSLRGARTLQQTAAPTNATAEPTATPAIPVLLESAKIMPAADAGEADLTTNVRYQVRSKEHPDQCWTWKWKTNSVVVATCEEPADGVQTWIFYDDNTIRPWAESGFCMSTDASGAAIVAASGCDSVTTQWVSAADGSTETGDVWLTKDGGQYQHLTATWSGSDESSALAMAGYRAAPDRGTSHTWVYSEAPLGGTA